ncbi:hypothetical protein BOTBODRAFT_27736 [Botryobasidium botryosum FD-172 SS1]|uniref:Uncharacterized protein n=1 Tax=Botryobasidium botryosum (strain FD-172 SS1) TaxID=930990 RepID=A0A067N9A2_BOTB1|nr:hypothetical protein BOTBODRAFT_27736 [Botryobasidium botryosum FD-172 SS1]
MDALKPTKPTLTRASSSFVSKSAQFLRGTSYRELKTETPGTSIEPPKEKVKRHEFRRSISRILGSPKQKKVEPQLEDDEVDGNPAREYLARHPYAFGSEVSLSSGSQGSRDSNEWAGGRMSTEHHPRGRFDQPESPRIYYTNEWTGPRPQAQRRTSSPSSPSSPSCPSSPHDYMTWNKASARLGNY